MKCKTVTRGGAANAAAAPPSSVVIAPDRRSSTRGAAQSVKLEHAAVGRGRAVQDGLLVGREAPIEEASAGAVDECVMLASGPHRALGEHPLIVGEADAEIRSGAISKRGGFPIGNRAVEHRLLFDRENEAERLFLFENHRAGPRDLPIHRKRIGEP